MGQRVRLNLDEDRFFNRAHRVGLVALQCQTVLL